METRTILVPVDFSHASDHALARAIELATHFGAVVHLLHAVHFPAEAALPDIAALTKDLEGRARDAAARKLEKASHRVTSAGLDVRTHLERRPPFEAIVATARSISADLIVMGTHGWSGLAHLALGSVAERTIRMAPCPVMTVREPADGESDSPVARERAERGPGPRRLG